MTGEFVQSLFGLEGRRALVTGGGTGIGRALAIGLAQAGAQVAVVGRREGVLNDVAEEIAALGGVALPMSLDISDPDALAEGMTKLVDGLGGLDILVNNAGADSPRTLMQTEEEDWLRTYDVNVVATWRLGKAVVAHWTEQEKAGSIINIASITGLVPQKGLAAYGISKAAALQMTRVMALEWTKYKVRVNTIAPGYYVSAMTEDFLKSPSGEKLLNRIPMRRAGEMEELVGACIYLASDASSYVTGSLLTVDGGHLQAGL